MKINKLTKKDIGKYVVYKLMSKDEMDKGKIKSWNDKFIFVVYKCDNNWDKFKDYTGVATDPNDLLFLDDIKNNIKKIINQII